MHLETKESPIPMNRPTETTPRTELPRVLGPIQAFCVVVGSVIGSGIFLVPARVAHEVPNLSGVLVVWIVGGLFSAAGALTLAELGAMLPRAGGLYVYLREAYGPLPAFLFGWVEFLVARTGSMATLAAAFARYFAQLAPPPAPIPGELWQAGAAVTAIAVVVVVNVLGTRGGGALQVVGTVLKVGGVLGLMSLPFVTGGGSTANFAPFWPEQGSSGLVLGMAAAMVSVLWAYDGWTNVTPLAEEIHEPGKNIPRALIMGMAVLVLVYISMTLAYHYVLPWSAIADTGRAAKGGVENAVAAIYCKSLIGQKGVVAISILVMCSTFISLNGNALSGPRAYFAMARDGVFPARLGRVHAVHETPAAAIIAQGVWAIALTILGTVLILVPPPTGTSLPRPILAVWATLNQTPLYDLLYTYVVFGANLFYMLAISSVFVLRVKRPDLHRPYRTLGYPVTPIVYVVASLFLLGSMIGDHKSQAQSLAGLGIILLGVPAYWYFRARGRVATG